jgi:hypothetical protein
MAMMQKEDRSTPRSRLDVALEEFTHLVDQVRMTTEQAFQTIIDAYQAVFENLCEVYKTMYKNVRILAAEEDRYDFEAFLLEQLSDQTDIKIYCQVMYEQKYGRIAHKNPRGANNFDSAAEMLCQGSWPSCSGGLGCRCAMPTTPSH